MKIQTSLLPLFLFGIFVSAVTFPRSAQAITYVRDTKLMANPSIEREERPATNSGLMMRDDKKENRTGLTKTNADREIDRRVTNLNKLIERINAMKRISADQKTALVTEVQSAITNLNTLKTKIAADTDAATLKADKQAIVTAYRVFLLLIPKIEIIAHADATLQTAAQMSADNATIQAKIQSLQTAGKDVTSLQTLLTDRQAKIADAQTQAQKAIDTVSSLTPAGYPGNRTTLMAARDLLKTARQDLQTAFQDLVKIHQSEKTL